ncbi:MAG: periplasmic heavy metal sensor [Deltaproteobacteria bacterium]|nr:periplasmic heavy metal sensor [Deltaproteobacteria bacterium]
MIKKSFIIFGLIILFAASPVFAQRGDNPGRRNSPISDSPCWTKPYLEATPEQLKTLENLHRSFYKEISDLRNQHMNLRYELRSLLDSSKPDRRMILEKQNQFSGIQKKMDEISIQYFLKARALFTPDQLSKLPSGCYLGFNYGSGKGWDRGMGKGKGYGRGIGTTVK